MMRPLRSASAREVGYYLHYAGLNAMPPPRALDMVNEEEEKEDRTNEVSS